MLKIYKGRFKEKPKFDIVKVVGVVCFLFLTILTAFCVFVALPIFG